MSYHAEKFNRKNMVKLSQNNFTTMCERTSTHDHPVFFGQKSKFDQQKIEFQISVANHHYFLSILPTKLFSII